MLSTHVNPDDIITRLHGTHIDLSDSTDSRTQRAESHITPYASRYTSQSAIPKYKIPENGAPSDTVYQMLKDELDLDEKPNLNLASFVTTWMEPTAADLLKENANKNLADADEYPALMQIHERCISILAHLWGVRPDEHAVGSATTGSSEAIHLGGLAMKRRWQERRKKEGKDISKPNIIMGANAQVALEKFARYFEVESRILPVSAKSQFRLDPELVKENIDENTIGIFVILGSTMTGHFEPVEEISKILDEYEEKTGISIPIHVDAASGGFIAPFTHAGVGGPKWHFELPRVVSINASGHKYGLVYPGVGWIVWRDESYLPESLVFTLDYLGGQEKSFTLNFSRPGAQVIVQYYNLIHLGFAGYREIMENCLSNARLLAKSLEATGWFTVVSDIHRRVSEAPSTTQSSGQAGSEPDVSASAAAGTVKSAVSEAASKVGGHIAGDPLEETSANYVAGLPIVAFRLSDEFKAQFPHIQQSAISLLMRAKQWIFPNYSLPPNEQNTEIMRIVIRENISLDLMEKLISDICEVTESLIQRDEVDLSLLQKPRKKVELKGHKDKKEKGFNERVEKETQRLLDGNLHRRVC